MAAAAAAQAAAASVLALRRQQRAAGVVPSKTLFDPDSLPNHMFVVLTRAGPTGMSLDKIVAEVQTGCVPPPPSSTRHNALITCG